MQAKKSDSPDLDYGCGCIRALFPTFSRGKPRNGGLSATWTAKTRCLTRCAGYFGNLLIRTVPGE